MKSMVAEDKMVFFVQVVVFFVLAFGFSVRKSATALPMILVIFSFILLCIRQDYREFVSNFVRKQWKLSFALASLSLFIVARELLQMSPDFKYADAASRFLFFIPICTLLIYFRISIEKVRWGFFCGVVFMFFSGFAHVYLIGGFDSGSNYGVRPSSYFTNTIPFSAFCLALAISFVVWSVGRSRLDNFCSFIVILLTALVLFFSQSRGVWIGLSFSIFSIVLIFSKNRKRDISAVFLFSCLLFCLLYYFSEMFATRINMAAGEVIDFLNGKKDGSVSMRLDMAMASFYIFQENTLFGVGRNVVPALQDLYHRGLIGAAISDAADTHGELFYNAASLGVFGFFSWVVFYCATVKDFVLAALGESADVKRIGVTGVSLMILFFFVGFTHITFGLSMYASYFIVLFSVLFASLQVDADVAGASQSVLKVSVE
ncbi:O-antigen ligase family protein [Craterilacuibacter sp. RT1T]|uniref:O-antigen ligase family protein n=1 Tax=Craterilacuibacter sp. RT1T TaxID=2942211 RepID=UPI0020BF7B42|nr:O-antigen ligase family protein [Craterilacuibacter sp. RT1T]MCL6264422.1 O-antigen ligase family protein [Craterilacuibacter sp. RT1T]